MYVTLKVGIKKKPKSVWYRNGTNLTLVRCKELATKSIPCKRSGLCHSQLHMVYVGAGKLILYLFSEISQVFHKTYVLLPYLTAYNPHGLIRHTSIWAVIQKKLIDKIGSNYKCQVKE